MKVVNVLKNSIIGALLAFQSLNAGQKEELEREMLDIKSQRLERQNTAGGRQENARRALAGIIEDDGVVSIPVVRIPFQRPEFQRPEETGNQYLMNKALYDAIEKASKSDPVNNPGADVFVIEMTKDGVGTCLTGFMVSCEGKHFMASEGMYVECSKKDAKAYWLSVIGGPSLVVDISQMPLNKDQFQSAYRTLNGMAFYAPSRIPPFSQTYLQRLLDDCKTENGIFGAQGVNAINVIRYIGWIVRQRAGKQHEKDFMAEIVRISRTHIMPFRKEEERCEARLEEIRKEIEEIEKIEKQKLLQATVEEMQALVSRMKGQVEGL